MMHSPVIAHVAGVATPTTYLVVGGVLVVLVVLAWLGVPPVDDGVLSPQVHA